MNTQSTFHCDGCGACCYYEIPLTILDIHREQLFEKYLEDKYDLTVSRRPVSVLETRNRRSVRSQKSEVGGQKSEGAKSK